MKLFLKSVKICEICGLKRIFDRGKPLFTMEEGIRERYGIKAQNKKLVVIMIGIICNDKHFVKQFDRMYVCDILVLVK
ncbi:MAG: hypothetical protein L6416_12045 [Candidatus Omnitrophica bacterium]|nr:hypothetical protein [Candidatus Omnitrophota bacterium]